MKIIVGLGNIGEKYTHTRHNIGFIFLHRLAHQLQQDGQQITWEENSKLKASIAKANIKGQSCLLVKPSTLMNLSGQAVSKILSYYKQSPEDLVVIYDDVDLPNGKIRIRSTGSAGTHNGMKSIIQEIGTKDFHRIRIGIESRGDLTPAQQDISSFVLTDFNDAEIDRLKPALTTATQELHKLLS